MSTRFVAISRDFPKSTGPRGTLNVTRVLSRLVSQACLLRVSISERRARDLLNAISAHRPVLGTFHFVSGVATRPPDDFPQICTRLLCFT